MHRTPTFAHRFVQVLVVGCVLAACTAADEPQAAEKPITVEKIAGTEVSLLTLSQSAADRLDIQNAPVASAGEGMVVPSAAVIIDTAGTYWVYTNPEPLVFLREEIENVHEEGHQAFFAVGPAIGTQVVTTGVPELYGAEFGIGK
jgi:hypothetical protein